MPLFTFTKPVYLILLALIPLIIFIHFYTLKRRRSRALKFANFEAISRVQGIDILSKNVFILFLTILISILLVLSLSGLTLHRTMYASSFSFGLAIDSSRSMEADDFAPNRLEAAKDTAISFVDLTSPGTKISVISFSGNSFIEQELTDDKPSIKQAIRGIPISAVGGTDLGEAVITSTNLLVGEEAKAVILLSDGRVNIGTVDLAINYANARDVIVHTVGIGTEEGGVTSYGSLSTIDEDALKGLAYNTGGQYFRAQNKVELDASFNTLLGLRLGKVALDLTVYLVVISLVLLIVEYVLVNTRFNVLP